MRTEPSFVHTKPTFVRTEPGFARTKLGFERTKFRAHEVLYVQKFVLYVAPSLCVLPVRYFLLTTVAVSRIEDLLLPALTALCPRFHIGESTPSFRLITRSVSSYSVSSFPGLYGAASHDGKSSTRRPYALPPATAPAVNKILGSKELPVQALN